MTTLVTIDMDGPARLRGYIADIENDDIAFCEDVLGEFPTTSADAAGIIGGRASREMLRKPGDAGWQSIGHARAIARWKTIAHRVADSFDDQDITRAEAAAAAYKATGQQIPARLAQFLEIETAHGSQHFVDDDGIDRDTLTEDPNLMATDTP